MDNDTEFIANALDNYGITDAGDSIITSLNCGKQIDDFGQISIDDSDSGEYFKQIESILVKYARTQEEGFFWVKLSDKNVYPSYIETLCLYLVSKEQFFSYGVSIYSILLGMDPFTKVWSPILFSPILKTLVTAQQIIEKGAQPNAQVKSQLKLAMLLLKNLTKAFSESFSNTIDHEILVALCEIAVKLSIGFRVELDTFNESFSTESLKLAGKIAKENMQFLLPFIVQVLTYSFATSSSSLTSRIEKTADRIVDFLLAQISPDNETIILVCKHLMLRAPEKSHLKKGVASIIYRLTKHSIYPQKIINYCMYIGSSAKTSQRSFSAYLTQLYLVNINNLSPLFGNDAPEIVMELASTATNLLSDIAPTVRAAALDSISLIIENLERNPFGAVIKNVVDRSGSLETVLTCLITDEKLVVRKAALQCLTQIITSNARSLTTVMTTLVSSRVRDRAVSMRVAAIRSLNSALTKFRNNSRFNRVWIDSVLPSIVDVENSVQMEAYYAIDEFIFQPLIRGEDEPFTKIMNPSHFEFMKNVFVFCKQKAMPLDKICKAFTKIALNDTANVPIWKLIHILTYVEKSHFTVSKFYDLWDLRENLPAEYYIILANLEAKSNEIRNDCTMIINTEIKENRSKYNLIHNSIQLLSIQTECEDIFFDMLDFCCNKLNEVSQTSTTSEADLMSLLAAIYALGDIILVIWRTNSTRLRDYDFTGLQLLIAHSLPNETVVPEEICAMAVISLGKLAIAHKDTSHTLVSAFAHLLSSSDTYVSVKCNCLIALCDLCVCYTALVDPYIKLMTNCFADSSTFVRHQALHVLTRLVVEDYLKMRPVLFFRYIFAVTDSDDTIASFAMSCLFNVIMNKYPSILKAHFIDTIMYFSGEVPLGALGESKEERGLFRIEDTPRRHKAIQLMMSRMDEVTSFNLVEAICKEILSKFVDGHFTLEKHRKILEDSIFAMNGLEDILRMSLETEVVSAEEDSTTEKFIETAKRAVMDFHNSMIHSVLPTLNKTHRLLRDQHSPLQDQLKMFYQRVCLGNDKLIQTLQKTEPLLALELQDEMALDSSYNNRQSDENNDINDSNEINDGRRGEGIIGNNGEEIRNSLEMMLTPTRKKGGERGDEARRGRIFESPLLSKIASTNRSLLCTPGKQAPSDVEEIADKEANAETMMIMTTPPRQNGQQNMFSTPPHNPDLYDL